MKIDAAYRSAPYEIKIKATLCFRALLFLDGLFALFIINLLVHQNINYLLWTFAIAEAAVIYATSCVWRGKYDLASRIIGPAIFLPMSVALTTMGLKTFSYVFEAAAYGAIFLVATVFIRSKRIIYLFGGFILFCLLLHIGLDMLNGILKLDSLMTSVLPAIVFIAMDIGAGMAYQSILRKISSDLSSELAGPWPRRKRAGE